MQEEFECVMPNDFFDCVEMSEIAVFFFWFLDFTYMDELNFIDNYFMLDVLHLISIPCYIFGCWVAVPTRLIWFSVLLINQLAILFWEYLTFLVIFLIIFTVPKKWNRKNKNIAIKLNTNNNLIFWWETWAFFNRSQNKLELEEINSWNMYLKYRLSIWNNWHILEDRIFIFLILGLFLIF